MQQQECQNQKNKFFLCINCMNCKKLNNRIYCKKGHFKNKSEKDIKTFTPYDFNCTEFR